MSDGRQARDQPGIGTVAWALWKMARPSQLALICLVYALGAAIAWATADALPLGAHLRGLAAMLAVAASVHYANEYADHETDRRTERTPFSGGSGALPQTGLPRRVALGAGFVSLAVAGVWVTTAARTLPSLALVLLAAVAVFGWQYSLPPLAFAWRGLGELANAALGGLLLPLYAVAVATGRVSTTAVLACLPFAVAVFLNLMDTQWPDRHADGAVGKDTLAVRWPKPRLEATYWVGVGAYAAATLALGWRAPLVVTATAAAALPALWYAGHRYTETRSPAPSVLTMVALVAAQTAAWLAVAL
jgi:1,4-dihydroxy-2-naphthoate octaprenyltransferase